MAFHRVCLLGLCLVAVVITVRGALNHGEQAYCTSDADCGSTECCVSFDKRRFIFPRINNGTCQPLRYQGHSCHVFLITDPHHPNMHVNYCPCGPGLECRGITVESTNSSQVVHHDPKCLPVET